MLELIRENGTLYRFFFAFLDNSRYCTEMKGMSLELMTEADR